MEDGSAAGWRFWQANEKKTDGPASQTLMPSFLRKEAVGEHQGRPHASNARGFASAHAKFYLSLSEDERGAGRFAAVVFEAVLSAWGCDMCSRECRSCFRQLLDLGNLCILRDCGIIALVQRCR